MSKVRVFGSASNSCAVHFDRDAVWLTSPPFQSAQRRAITEDAYQELCKAWPHDLGMPLRILGNDTDCGEHLAGPAGGLVTHTNLPPISDQGARVVHCNA
jgi:hypothetical protein